MTGGAFGFHQSANGEIRLGSGSNLFLSSAGDEGLNGGRIVGPGDVSVLAQGFPIQDVELAGGVDLGFIGNTGILIGPGGLTNNARINTGSNGFIASNFGATATIDGDGRLQMEGGRLGHLFGGAGYALVNGPNHTIGGHGAVLLALTNHGDLLADRNGLSSGPGELLL